MLKHLILASLMTVSVTAVGYAETFNGPITIENKNFRRLEINGPAKLKAVRTEVLRSRGSLNFQGLTVNDKMEVRGTIHGSDLKCKDLKAKGPTEISKATIEDVEIFGRAELERIKVTGDMTIRGDASIKRGRLRDIEFHSDEMTLDDTYAERIVIEGEEATLVLKGETVIAGDIIFKDGNGIVKKGRHVHINGRVRGGRVESMRHRWGLFGTY